MSALLKLPIHATPGAKRTEAAGEHGGALRVRLGAPPVDGKANAALLRFLADELDLPVSAIAILRGETGRNKTLRIAGRSAVDIRSRLGRTG